MSSKNWTDLGPVRVNLYTGESRFYSSIDEAVRQTNWRFLHFRRQNGRFLCCSPDMRYWQHDTWLSTYGACELRDELGFLIPDWVIENAIDRNDRRYDPTKRYRYGRSSERTAYRRPKGGHNRSGKPRERAWRRTSVADCSYHDLAPRRAAEAILLDEDLKDLDCTIKLRRRSLFDAWDWAHDGGKGVGNYHNQGWKRHRLHQYRG